MPTLENFVPILQTAPLTRYFLHLADELTAIYMMTVFEEGLLNTSPWSKVWQTRDELDRMEYLQNFRVLVAAQNAAVNKKKLRHLVNTMGRFSKP